MESKGIIDYFEEVETEKEYRGYFCKVSETVSIAIPVSLCGLKTSAVRSISSMLGFFRTRNLIGK